MDTILDQLDALQEKIERTEGSTRQAMDEVCGALTNRDDRDQQVRLQQAQNFDQITPPAYLGYKPMPFSGYPTEDGEDWMERFEGYVDCVQPHTGDMKLKTACHLMEGRARKWSKRLLQRQPDLLWPNFRTAFLKEFGMVSDHAALILERQCFMCEGEPITTYIHRVQDIFDRLGYDDGERLCRFMRCIDADLKKEIERIGYPVSCDQAMDYARQVEEKYAYIRGYGGRATAGSAAAHAVEYHTNRYSATGYSLYGCPPPQFPPVVPTRPTDSPAAEPATADIVKVLETRFDRLELALAGAVEKGLIQVAAMGSSSNQGSPQRQLQQHHHRSGNRPMHEVTCYNCGGRGHFARDYGSPDMRGYQVLPGGQQGQRGGRPNAHPRQRRGRSQSPAGDRRSSRFYRQEAEN